MVRSSLPVDGQASHLRRAAIWLAVGSLIILAAPAAGGAGGGGRVAQLRAHAADVSADQHTVVLALYGLDSRLASAQSQLAALRQRVDALRRERADAAAQLAVARHGVSIAEARLADRLRTLYEQRDVSPLEVLLGAGSLDEALTALDDLERAAREDTRVLGRLRGARARMTALDRALAEREARIARLRAGWAATATSLARARAERGAYVARLARERALTDRKIASLERRARAAQERAVALNRPTAPRAEAADPTGGFSRRLTVAAIAYSLPGHTYIGIPVGKGVVAVDPNVIPLGMRMTIPGYGEGIAADIGTAVRGTIIDLWFPTLAQARSWGRRTVTITLHQ